MGETATTRAGGDARAPGGRRWERLAPDERRAQILRCARRLFTAQPYAAVSMEEVARAAGVRRGLVNHYFGSKRELFLAVVKDLLSAFDRAFPPAALPPAPPARRERAVDEVMGDLVDRWLGVVESDAEGWFAFVSAEGFGRDPDVERLVDRYREAVVERIVAVLDEMGTTPPGAGPELRAVLRSYSGMADLVTREWLLRGTLDRGQACTLLTATLLTLVRDVLPTLSGGGRRAGRRG